MSEDQHSTEGASFTGLFNNAFGDEDATASRMKLVRRSGQSSKQRARKALRTEQINFRVSPEFKAALAALADAMDCTMSDAIDKAVFAMLKAQKVKVD